MGDTLETTGEMMEPIPYPILERIMWYLDTQESMISIPHLAREIGLSTSYYRAIPGMLRRLDTRYQSMVDCPSLRKQQLLL